ncbi:MAG TPA: hypothetical protein VEL07_06205 [Planctomycetota bacterium]|nr:hypothetical protein [Planctomycetota bacterium]
MNLFETELNRLRGMPEGPIDEGLLTGNMVIKSAEDHDVIIRRAMEALRVVDETILSDWKHFPTLEQWSAILPHWFIDACGPERSKEESLAWLKWFRSLPLPQQGEAMRESKWSLNAWTYWFQPAQRNWYWGRQLGSDGEHFMVELWCIDWPCATDSFSWLVRAAGAEACAAE